MDRLCRACGRTFKHIGGTRGMFCSVICYRMYRAGSPPEYLRVEYVPLVCHQCGANFQRRKAEVRGGFHYCSQSCAGKTTGRLPKRAPRQPPVNKVCEVCGQPFLARASQVNPRFCSRACDGRYRSLHQTGAANPNYRHGTAPGSALQTAKRNYPFQCAICGWAIALEVHHITPKSRGGTNHPDNLALLCPNHHKMADLGLLPLDELQAALSALRLQTHVA